MLYASFTDNIKEVTFFETNKGRIEQTTKYVSLKIAYKIIAVYSNNATNNNTFYNHFYRIL